MRTIRIRVRKSETKCENSEDESVSEISKGPTTFLNSPVSCKKKCWINIED
jgi:hypothetical protein